MSQEVVSDCLKRLNMLLTDFVIHLRRVVHPSLELLILQLVDLFLVFDFLLLLDQSSRQYCLFSLRYLLLDFSF